MINNIIKFKEPVSNLMKIENPSIDIFKNNLKKLHYSEKINKNDFLFSQMVEIVIIQFDV